MPIRAVAEAAGYSVSWDKEFGVTVKDGGEIAGGGHADFRRILLEEERVSFLPDGRVDMEKCRYVPTIELLLTEDEE